MTGSEPALAIARTQRWLDDVVIGLALCPFAAAPARAGRIAYRVCEDKPAEAVYQCFLQTLEGFAMADAAQQETALLIVTEGLADFSEYLDLLALAEQAVSEAGLTGVIQLASFHPDYCFAGAPADDPANFTNRSPYPMFHLIREDGLEAALASYRHPERIPERNVQRLRALGLEGIRALQRQVVGPNDREAP
ncbi:MAG: DUF1415 domain-containing protein [Sedimenticolaceae bacterium]